MDTQQAASVLQNLRALHRHLDSDLTLVLEESMTRRFPVHKTVIALFSGYFRTLLEEGKLTGSEYKLDGVTHEELGVLIDFMYTGSMDLTGENYRRVVTAAETLQMPLVVEALRKFEERVRHLQTLELPKVHRTTRNMQIRIQNANKNNSPTAQLESSSKSRGQKRKVGLDESVPDKVLDSLPEEDNISSKLRRSARRRVPKIHLDEMPDQVLGTRKKPQKQVEISHPSFVPVKNESGVDQNSSTSTLQGTDSHEAEGKTETMSTDSSIQNESISTKTPKRSRGRPRKKADKPTETMDKKSDKSSILVPMKTDFESVEHVAASMIKQPAETTGDFRAKNRRITRTIDPKKTSKCGVCKKRLIHHSLCQLHMRTHGYVTLRHSRPATIVQAQAASLVLESPVEIPCALSNDMDGANQRLTALHTGQSITTTSNGTSNAMELHLGASKDLPDLVARIHEYSYSGRNQPDVHEGIQHPTASHEQATCGTSSNFHAEERAQPRTIYSIKSGVALRKQKRFQFSKVDRTYTCRSCGKSFPLYALCKRHCMKEHCQKFRCLFCHITLSSQRARLQHQRLLHAEMHVSSVAHKYSCTVCKRRFGSKKECEDHRTTECEPNPILKCSECSCTFEEQAQFLKHPCVPKLSENDMCISRGFKQRKKLYQAMIKKVQSKDGQKFLCNTHCKRSSKTLYLARIHAIHKHKKSKLYNAVKKRLPTVTFPCAEEGCKHKAITYMKLILHVKRCHPEASYQCQTCPYITNLKGNLDVHFQQKHVTKNRCSLCEKNYSKASQLRIHQASVHGLKDPSVQEYHCPVLNCEYIAYQKTCMTQHMNRHVSEKPFTCCECGLKVKTERTLGKHMKKVHFGIRPYICDQCGATYGDYSELKTHIARHSPTRKFACELCSYASIAKGDLKTHMWSQHKRTMDSKQKILKCELCGYTTDRKVRYREHQDSHSRIRKYPCDQCPQIFVLKNTLVAHIKWKHKPKSHKCDFCDHQTATMHHLRQHVRLKHTHKDVKPYKCPYCSFQCATNGNCRKHVMSKHKGLEVYYLITDPSMQSERSKRGQVKNEIPTGSYDAQVMEVRTASKIRTPGIAQTGAPCSTLQPLVVNQNVTSFFSQVPTTISGAQLENTVVPIYQVIDGTQEQVLPEIEVQVYEQGDLPGSALYPVACQTVVAGQAFTCPSGVVYGNDVLVDSSGTAPNVTVVTESCPSVLPPSGEHAYYGTAV